jgi:uncharacterized protein YbjT (DUF2867 family)
MHQENTILLTGATGYVGGRLLKRLEFEGRPVNCLVRNPGRMNKTASETRVFKGDVLDRASMWHAFQGVDTAYYMVHFLNERDGFEEKERVAAENFAAEARAAGVRRIIYLGGLGNERDALSPHLKTRHETGRILSASGIPTIELRASIVLGAGSLSFNLIRDLAEHLPAMIMPRWVSTKAQPIGINDLLDYLVQAVDISLEKSEVVEVGGADRMSYRDLMREYARQRGLKRLMIPVPVLTPWLSSHWLSFFTEVDPLLGRRLIEGVKNPTVVESSRARQLFNIVPAEAAEAMRIAIQGDGQTAPESCAVPVGHYMESAA